MTNTRSRLHCPAGPVLMAEPKHDDADRPAVDGAEHGEPDTVRDAYDRMIRDGRAG